MRLRNSVTDAADGSQLFEDTSGAAPGSQAGYRWGGDLPVRVELNIDINNIFFIKPA